MASVGDTKQQYRRNYVCVNPDESLGPATWRLASPQSIGTPGSGGDGTGPSYDFDGVAPINVDMKPGPGNVIVETSMDINQLEDRTT